MMASAIKTHVAAGFSHRNGNQKFAATVLLGLSFFFLMGQQAVRAQDEKPEDNKKKEPDTKSMDLLLQRAQEEYRIFFHKPEKVPEFWAAIKFEVGVGKFDLAALHLKLLLQKEPTEEVDRELLKIEQVEGLSSFLRLQTIRQWSTDRALQKEADKNVKTLIDRVTAALDKYLSNPDRLNQFIKSLDARSIEERMFAFAQLNRARERAVPYFVQALQTSGNSPLHGRIIEALVKLDEEVVPPLLETLKAVSAKDAQDLPLRLTVLDILKRRGDKRAVPYLWHLANARMYPAQIHEKARALLAYLLSTQADRLPPGKVSLTELAERCFQHKTNFGAGRPVQVWPWNGQQLATRPVQLTPSQAEEFFGLRYARESLDLDPKYEPAQVVLLCLTLERSLGPNLDQALLKPMPAKLQQLLATVDTDLLRAVLERGLNEGNIPIIVATAEALGERGDSRAAQPSSGATPRGLLRALYYPDRRVQLAAVKALMRLPAGPTAAAPGRVVEILKRFLAVDAQPKLLMAYIAADKAADVRQRVKEIGFEPVLVKSAKDIFDRLGQSADYDAIFLGSSLPTRDLSYLLTNLRADADQGRLPILVFVTSSEKGAVGKAAEQFRNVKVYPDVLLTMGDELKTALDDQIKDASGAKLTAAERKEFARVALDVLWRMARGEIQGYDLRPAQQAVVEALRQPDAALEALEILGRMPGQEPQARLAAVVLNLAQGKNRIPAAIELNRHIQKYGLMLDKIQMTSLKEAFKTSDDDPALRSQLALVIGSMRPGPQATGLRLFEYRPDLPMPPAEKKEKEKDAR
jgi:CheY-like chemotaxis protein